MENNDQNQTQSGQGDQVQGKAQDESQQAGNQTQSPGPDEFAQGNAGPSDPGDTVKPEPKKEEEQQEKDLPESKGAKKIYDERLRQLTEEGYDEDHDKANSAGELKAAAMFLLDPVKNTKHYPSWWDRKWKKKWITLAEKERIILAGALLAAEYDRLHAEEVLNRVSASVAQSEIEGAE